MSKKLALYVRLHAKPGKEADLEEFLKSALPLVENEPETSTWYALKFGPATFGIFDTFSDEYGRQKHLSGKIAEALMANAADLLAEMPLIETVDLVAVKGQA
jgi:quinol monooxygenase YgiN